MDPAVKRTISTIPDVARETIQYTDAIRDETTGKWTSPARSAHSPAQTSAMRAAAQSPQTHPGPREYLDLGQTHHAAPASLPAVGNRVADAVRGGLRPAATI